MSKRDRIELADRILRLTREELADRIMRGIRAGLSDRALLILVEELQRRLMANEK